MMSGRQTSARWLRFNLVGVAGAAVQLGALWVLMRLAGLQYIIATVLAVEIAVLHNFVWHETWTWRGLPVERRWIRLARFHVANGFFSIGANALFTWLFRHWAGVPVLAANAGAICVTALITFALAHLWVFHDRRYS